MEYFATTVISQVVDLYESQNSTTSAAEIDNYIWEQTIKNYSFFGGDFINN